MIIASFWNYEFEVYDSGLFIFGLFRTFVYFGEFYMRT